MNKTQLRTWFMLLVLLLFFAGFAQATAQEVCNSSGSPDVTTDMDDYAPFDVVTVTGSGFGCGETLSVLVTAPDSTTRSGDGSGAAGPDLVTTDENGEFVLSYELSGTLPDGSVYMGQEGLYTIEVLDATGVVVASAAFSDGLGGESACALTTQGGVKCWGANNWGQLGNGTTSYGESTPVDVVGLTSGVVQVSSQANHSCALLADNNGVKCWGYNAYGQLGDGSSGNVRTTPVDVVGLDGDVIQIGVGTAHTCALMANGGVKCWGDNSHRQFGNASAIGSLTPVNVLTRLPPDYDELVPLSDVIQIDVGDRHNCVVTATGGAKCWGWNYHGQAGRGPNKIDAIGVALDVDSLTDGVLEVSAGHSHSCALMETGGVKCWGINIGSQLGDGTQTTTWIPQDVVYEMVPDSGQLAPLSGMTQVSAGYYHSCALTAGGEIACWGGNAHYERGDGTNIWKAWATFTTGLNEEINQVASGQWFTCGLTASNGVKCWGQGSKGQLGNGTFHDSQVPVDVVGLTSGVAQLTDHYLSCSTNQPPVADAGGPYAGDEGAAIPLSSANASDPDADPLTFAWSVDSALCAFDDASLLNPNLTCSDNGSFNITLTVDDATNPPVSADATVTVNNVAPTLNPINVDQQLVPVGTTINASASFTDPGILDTHTGAWDWGDASSAGDISESGGSGTASDSHSYSAPGVYTLRLVVTDKDGALSNEAVYEFVVVYDPEGGFVTGGGWFTSPPGAYYPDPGLSGKAHFGFVSKYKKGATIPTGQSEFQFKAGDLNFRSSIRTAQTRISRARAPSTAIRLRMVLLITS